MSDWVDTSLGDIAEIQTGPFGSQLHMRDYKPVGTPIITVEHLGDNRITRQNLPFVGDADKERLSKYLIFEGDIVFSRVGSVDRRAYVSKEEDGWMFSGRLLRVRTDKNSIDPKFLSYYFGQESFKEYIRRIAVGATMPSINTTILSEVEISYPPLPEQKAIAAVLSSLDDKINLLQRQNATLEAIAQTLFRQWFVEEAEDDWEDKPVSFFGDVICGKTPSKKVPEYFGGNIPFIKIPNMHGKTFVFQTTDYLSNKGKDSQIKKTLPPRSISVSCIATVGLVVMNAFESHTNQQINSIVPYQPFYRYFLYLQMSSMTDELVAMASGGTATLNLNTGNFSKMEIISPPENLLEDFHEIVEPIFEKIFRNQKQIQTLEKLRDTLLPKLMSGEVRVRMQNDEG